MTLLELAEKFEEAGRGDVDITEEDLAVLGLKMQKSFKSKTANGRRVAIDGWERLCVFVYENLANEAAPKCNLMGRGFRSKAFGRMVAEAIRRKA